MTTKSNDLVEWVNALYGDGKEFRSARDLSKAISEGRNPNAVSDIEAKGFASVRYLMELARVTNTPRLELFRKAGWIEGDPGEHEHDARELKALNIVNRLSDEYADLWLNSGDGLVRLTSNDI